jgi:DNA repair photolyase
MNPNRPTAAGRGSAIDPPNRFTRIEYEEDLEYLEHDEDACVQLRSVRTEYFCDNSKTVVTQNDSPDIKARFTLNPYRGCLHGCSYCFARPTHEYLDLNAGLDFETKIFVKEKAPELFRDWLGRSDWQAEPIMMSGVTDCYQPAERHFRLTRRCLEVALEARQPICIVTKNALVTRDLDILREMAKLHIVNVAVSITSLDQSLLRVMEPRTSSAAARLRAFTELREAGVPTCALLAPIIPGLNDFEIPRLLQAVKEAGADAAGYVLLRLPWTVKPVFLEWLERTQPDKKQRIESRIRDTRGGKMYEAEFGTRMTGRGEMAEQIQRTFEVFARKHGLDRRLPPLDTTQFRPPASSSGQGWLFPD